MTIAGGPDSSASFRHGGAPSERSLQVVVVAYLLLSVVNLGCMAAYGANHSMEIPLLEHANDAALFPNDPLAATFTRHASYYWKIVALFTQHAPFEPFLRAMVILQRALMLYAAAALARFFAPKSLLAVVACLGVLVLGIPYLRLASSDVGLAIYAEQSSLALAFVLLGMVAFVERARFWWAIFLACAALLNVFLSVHALAYFAFAFIFVREYRSDWRKWILPALLMGALVLPLIPLLLPALKATHVSADLWIRANRIRSAHHLFPTTWPLVAYARLLALSILALVSTRLTTEKNSLRSRLLVAFSAAAIFWLGLAFASTQVFHSVSLLCLQPGRALAIFEDVVVIALLSSLARATEERSAYGMVALAAAMAWIGDFQAVPRWQLAFVATVFLVATISAIASKGRKIPPRSTMLAVALTLCLIPRVVLGALGDRNPTGKFSAALTRDQLPEYAALALEAKARTTNDATFLVPPDWENFRPISERSVFVTYKDGTASFYDRDYLEVWIERLRAIGFDLLAPSVTAENAPELLAHAYDALDDSRVAQIAATYRVDYWIVPDSKNSRFPVAFGSDGFKALRLSSIAKDP